LPPGQEKQQLLKPRSQASKSFSSCRYFGTDSTLGFHRLPQVEAMAAN